MNNKQQTAVEWLIDQMFKQGYFDGNKPLTFTNLDHLQQQAKEMEKHQTLDFTRNAVRKILDEDRQNPFNLEQYYKETYGGNK